MLVTNTSAMQTITFQHEGRERWARVEEEKESFEVSFIVILDNNYKTTIYAPYANEDVWCESLKYDTALAQSVGRAIEEQVLGVKYMPIKA